MPQYQPPEQYPDWAEGQGALVSQPTPSQLSSGFVPNERPSVQTTNWLFRTIGRSIRWLSQGVITATLQGSEQQFDWRLIGGGTWSWTATTGVLAWSEAFSLAMPGLTDATNTCAAGSVTLTAGQVAHANCNAPFSTTGTLTSGSKVVSELGFESGVVVGATVTGAGVPSGATVVSMSAADNTVTLSAAATASAANVALVFATSGPLTVRAADSATFVPSGSNVVLARCVAVTDMPDQVVVGMNAGVMLLRDGERKRLLGQGFVSSRGVLAGEAVAARVPLYISPGAIDVSRSPGRVYQTDTTATSTSTRATFAGFSSAAAASGAGLTLVNSGVLGGFTGLVTGTAYYATGVGAIGQAPRPEVGSWTSPVGIALSNTELLVTAGGPATRVPTYRSRVELGGISIGSAGATSAGTTYPMTMATLGGTLPAEQVMGASGSITSVLLMWLRQAPGEIALQINGMDTPFRLITVDSTTNLRQQNAIVRGTTGYTFKPGDYITASFKASSAASAYLRIAVEVELSGA